MALGATLGKAEVVKTWKSVMKALGFVYRENMFHLKDNDRSAPTLYNFDPKKLALRNVHDPCHDLNQEPV